MTGTGQHVFSSMALHSPSYEDLVKNLFAVFRARVTGPYAAWKTTRHKLEEIERLSERDLIDIGYSREQLRTAVLNDTDMLH